MLKRHVLDLLLIKIIKKERIEELEDLWNILHENFGETIPNKCHVIFSLVLEFIKRQIKTIRRIFRISCRECTSEVGSDLAMVYCKRFRKRTSWNKCVNQFNFNSFNI